MPRKPRVQFEGAVCHVMCRGDHREPIVQDDVDRAEFVRCLGEARQDRMAGPEELLAMALETPQIPKCGPAGARPGVDGIPATEANREGAAFVKYYGIRSYGIRRRVPFGSCK